MTQNDITDRLDDLEAQLDDQQGTIEHQQERIDEQAETIERQQARLEEQDAIIQSQRQRLDEEATPASEAEPAGQDPAEPETPDENAEGRGPIATRRGVLTAGSVLGLLGLGAGSASADASGQIGTSSDPLKTLYTEELNGGVTDDTPLTNIAGSNLSIDNSGNLNAAGGGSGSWVEGDNTNLLEPDSKDGIEVDTVADNGSGSVTMNSTLDLTDNQINYGTNAGSQTLANLPFGSSQRAGSTNAYAMQLDGDDVLTINGVNDGSGNLNNAYVLANKELRLSGTLNTQDGTIENTTGGLTVTTNDYGNLTLNPGANNELTLSNQTTASSGSLLAIDGSGNVVEASGTTLSDVGGGSAAWGDGDADNLLEPSDGTKTGIEGINEIRTNNSLTVNIDATDDSTSETFTVQQNTDGTATSLLTVNEGGRVDVNNGNLDLNGNNIRNVGGSESAGSGALRLANGATVTAETNAGGSAIELLKTDASDNVTLGRGAPNNANTVTVQGPHSDDNLKFGGSPGAKLNASGDLELDFDADNSGGTSDSLNVVGSDGTSDVTYFQVKNDGTVNVNNGNLNLSSNGSIQASSTDHLQFDGSGTVTVPNGNLDVNSNRISNTKEIHSDNNNITFKGTADVNLDGTRLTEKGGDMNIVSVNSVNIDIDNDDNDADGNRDFNVTKDGGATKLFTVNDGGDVDVHNGNLDVQGGTVENSTGDLILSSSGDVQVQPSTASDYTIEGAQTGSMTKDPSSDTPDGYIQIVVDGTTREIPFYNVGPS